MGSGKSTVGSSLAAALGLPFVDSDAMVFAATGSTAADLAARLGVPELHRIERRLLTSALASTEPTVIASAASVVDDPPTRRVLGAHTCIWVDADPAVVAERRSRDPHRRPIEPDECRRLDAIRRPHLAALCPATVDTGAMTPGECVAAILASLPAPS
jgi:shikimate kinase